MAKQAYTVLSPVEYDRFYAAGETIEMETGEAAQLLEAGVICDPEDPRAAALADGPVDEETVVDRAIDAIRQAPPAAVRAFFDRLGQDPDIRAKLDGEATRRQQLLDAIDGLEEGNEAHWTKSGKPEVRALQEATGLDGVSAAERDAAWAAFQGRGAE